jgi:hypothetical protein
MDGGVMEPLSLWGVCLLLMVACAGVLGGMALADALADRAGEAPSSQGSGVQRQTRDVAVTASSGVVEPPLFLASNAFDDPLCLTAAALPRLLGEPLPPLAVAIMRVTSEKTRTPSATHDGRCEHRLMRVKLGPLPRSALN